MNEFNLEFAVNEIMNGVVIEVAELSNVNDLVEEIETLFNEKVKVVTNNDSYTVELIY